MQGDWPLRLIVGSTSPPAGKSVLSSSSASFVIVTSCLLNVGNGPCYWTEKFAC